MLVNLQKQLLERIDKLLTIIPRDRLRALNACEDALSARKTVETFGTASYYFEKEKTSRLNLANLRKESRGDCLQCGRSSN